MGRLFSFVFFALVSSMVIQPAYSGNVDGVDSSGGGDRRIIYLTPEQVKKSIDLFRARVGRNDYNFGFSELNFSLIADAQARQALMKLFAPEIHNGATYTSVAWDVLRSPFVYNETGPCLLDDGSPADASTAHRMGASICVSVYRLQSLPKEIVDSQIHALMFHELTHHQGYDEQTASRVQLYVLKEMFGFRTGYRESIFTAALRAQTLAKSFAQNDFSSHFCDTKERDFYFVTDYQAVGNLTANFNQRVDNDQVQERFPEIAKETADLSRKIIVPLANDIKSLEDQFCSEAINRQTFVQRYSQLSKRYDKLIKDMFVLFAIQL